MSFTSRFFSSDGPWGQNPKRPSGPQRPQSNELDELIEKARDKAKNMFGNGGKKGQGDTPPWNLILFAGIIVSLIWIASGIYTVNTREEGVVLRFGEFVGTTSPGLRYHLPYPIERVIKLRVTERFKEEIGYRSSVRERGGDTTREILMLTGDENIVDVNFEVQWQIASAEKFLFNIKNPELTVRLAAESAMREVIGTTPINSILSEGRATAQDETRKILQEILDSYDAGIDIKEINMRAIPPTQQITIEDIVIKEDGSSGTKVITTNVDEAFKDVQAAKINKEEAINRGIAYSNEVIPVARGQAQEKLQQAQGYKEQVIAKATGEAQRFNSIYEEYRKAKKVVRTRLYLETLEEVLPGMDKIIMEGGSGAGALPYLPLKELNRSAK